LPEVVLQAVKKAVFAATFVSAGNALASHPAGIPRSIADRRA
jgi:hypothetical protein